eukprot:3098932-Amphidinium_carterae.1
MHCWRPHAIHTQPQPLELSLGYPLNYSQVVLPTAARKHSHTLDLARRAMLQMCVQVGLCRSVLAPWLSLSYAPIVGAGS